MILDAIEQVGGIYVVTADHGNAEDMVKRNKKGEPLLDKNGNIQILTSHTCEPVSIFVLFILEPLPVNIIMLLNLELLPQSTPLGDFFFFLKKNNYYPKREINDTRDLRCLLGTMEVNKIIRSMQLLPSIYLSQ